MSNNAKLSDLIPDSSNANTGTERGSEMIETSLEQLGAGRSILLDRNGRIIAGNKTVKAAGNVGIDDVVIVDTTGNQVVAVRRTDLDLDDPTGRARQLAYADNRTSQVSMEFDPDVLAADLEAGVELGNWFDDWELEDIGIGTGEPLEDGDAEPQISRADELQKEWGVELGQMWRLPSRVEGQEHRIICGDCTHADIVERVMGGEKADGAFTSPPYAMQRKDTYGGVPESEYVSWWNGVQSIVRNVLEEKGSYFVNIKPHTNDGQRVLYVFDLVISMVRDHQWQYVDEYCWRNTKNGVPGKWNNRFKNAFEPVYHFAKSQPFKMVHENVSHDSDAIFDYHILNKDSQTGSGFIGHEKHLGYKRGKALPSNVLEFPAENEGLHPAPFPIELPSFFINAFSNICDIWYEPFSGSGTTIIAAENLSRQCRAVEISPAYVAVSLQRYKDAFGIEPELITQ